VSVSTLERQRPLFRHAKAVANTGTKIEIAEDLPTGHAVPPNVLSSLLLSPAETEPHMFDIGCRYPHANEETVMTETPAVFEESKGSVERAVEVGVVAKQPLPEQSTPSVYAAYWRARSGFFDLVKSGR